MSNKYTIDVGEHKILQISSRVKYSLGQLEVQIGEYYSFQVDMNGPRWWDMVIPTRGEGWDIFLSPNKGRRLPSERLLYLCGCINENDSLAFGIGNHFENWKVEQAGELSFFANDYPAMYFNNWGAINLTVTRIK